jgi:glycosyltransferase involved in cell wall biosynthesis
VKVLVVGLYREPSGYAVACRDTILALERAGADVACRPIQFTPNRVTDHPRLAELERKPMPRPDLLYQLCPPYAQQYCGNCVNVGSFYAETDPLPLSWAVRADALDAQIVPNAQMAGVLRRNPHFSKPVHVVPVPVDAEKFTRKYERPAELGTFGDGRFLFYTVGEWARRKNASGLLKAYFAEFKPWEPVGLVIKTGIANRTAEEARKAVEADVRQVREGCKLAHTPPVLIVTERMSDDALCGLHQACDAFVQPSYGESWALPCVDALGFGKTPIVTDEGGYREYVDGDVGWLVPARPEMVFAEGDTHAELFSGRHLWNSPDLLALRRCMREAYEDAAARAAKAARGPDRVKSLDRGRVGAALLKAFEDVQKERAARPPREVVRLGRVPA